MAKVKTVREFNKSIPKYSYGSQMGIVGTKGKLCFNLVGCKEEMYHSIGKYIIWGCECADSRSMLGYGDFKDTFNIKKSRLVFYVDIKEKFTKARRINKILKMLAKKHELKKPKVYISDDEKSNAVIIRVDSWYFASPVAMSGLLTFIRGAATTIFDFKSLKGFIKSLKDICERNIDGQHLYEAGKNLDGFLEKSLTIFSKSTYGAYSLGKLKNDIPYDGIVCYGSNAYSDITNGVWPDSSDDYCTCDYCIGECEDD